MQEIAAGGMEQYLFSFGGGSLLGFLSGFALKRIIKLAVETKVSKTRRLSFTCSVIATSNDTQKLKEPLLSRFAVIEMKGYTIEAFRRVALDVLKRSSTVGIHY